eukprot:819882-Pyramimonas_sp.AAC.1
MGNEEEGPMQQRVRFIHSRCLGELPQEPLGAIKGGGDDDNDADANDDGDAVDAADGGGDHD